MDSGVPGGGGPSFEKPAGQGGTPGGGPSFEKPAGSLHQPAPAPGLPGGPVPQGGTFELSGWWRRVGATIIDSIILTIPFIPIALIVLAIFGVSVGGNGDDASDAGIIAGFLTLLLLVVIYAALALIYAPYFMAKWNGATPGKRATGIRVVRADGLPITFGFAAIREVVVKQIGFGIVSSFTLGLATLLDYLWALWDPENRCLHDLVVNTRVVRD